MVSLLGRARMSETQIQQTRSLLNPRPVLTSAISSSNGQGDRRGYELAREMDASKSLAKIDLSILPVFTLNLRFLGVLKQVGGWRNIAITLPQTQRVCHPRVVTGRSWCNRLVTPGVGFQRVGSFHSTVNPARAVT